MYSIFFWKKLQNLQNRKLQLFKKAKKVTTVAALLFNKNN